MPGRILTMQRELREVGRLRSGYTGPKGPVRSKTWILTSKDRELLDAAAAEWGGQVVEWTPLNRTDKQWSLTTETAKLPAQLPPGDPLSQANELWSGGGAQRRCDGITMLKTGKPCLCLAQFGEDWHTQDKKVRCQPYSHLNLMLLNLPDVGRWRHTTKSFYAAGEIAGQVDLIKARVGPEPIVPIWLVIDQREKLADGKRTPYPVPIIRIRGAESGAALLAGQVPTLELGAVPERPAIAATPAEMAPESATTVEQFKTLANLARDPDTIRTLWERAAKSRVLDDGLKSFFTARAQDLGAAVKPNGTNGTQPVSAPPAPTEPPVEADADEPDPNVLWTQIMALAGAAPRRWSADDLEQRVTAMFERSSIEINGWQMAEFIKAMEKGDIQ